MALAGVLVIGLAGVVGIGILSPGEAFFVLGAATAVLSLAVAGLLFSMHRTLNLLKDQQSTIDALQDSRARAVSEEQGRTDRSQEDEIAELRSRLAELSDEQGHSDRSQEDEISEIRSLLADLIEEQSRSDRSQEDEIAEIRSLLADLDAANNGGSGSPQATPFGDVHPVVDVEGIGEDFTADLETLGIMDTEQLWTADPDAVASALNIPRKTVRSWQRMTELMALQDVGPQYAELLVRARITSIEQLSEMTPAEVAQAVQKAEGDREVRIQGNKIGEKHTKTWVKEARDHEPKGVRVQR